MTDSRIVAFGAIGLLAILSAKFLLLKELPQISPSLANPTSNIFFNRRYFLLTLWAGHSLSRLMPMFTIQFSQYVTDAESSKSKPVTSSKLSAGEFILAC